MGKYLIGALIGAGLMLVLAVAVIIAILPKPPSAHGPRLPVSDSPAPAGAGAGCAPDEVGFDIYTNPKAPPVLRKDGSLPAVHTMMWSASSDHVGRFDLRKTIWLAIDGKLHKFVSFQDRHETTPNRFVRLVTFVTVDEKRHLTFRAIAAELGIDRTFDPVPLPGAKVADAP